MKRQGKDESLSVKHVRFDEELYSNEERDSPVINEAQNIRTRNTIIEAERARKKENEDAKKEDGDDQENEEEDDDEVGDLKTVEWKDLGEERYGQRELDELDVINVEPFNLDKEKQVGKFDSTGGYTWNRKDLDDEEDEAWLQQVGNQVASVKKRQENDEAEIFEPSNVSIWKIIKNLKPKENSLHALKRLPKNSSDFVQLTESCDRLLNAGFVDVYTKTREELIQRLQPISWEYKIQGAEEVHGPFLGSDMQDWREMGYFLKDSEEKCVAKRVGANEWRPAENIETFLIEL